jgi:hypothetical protein
MLMKWAHVPTPLGAPVGDQDRTAQILDTMLRWLHVAEVPTISESSVRNTVHAILQKPNVLERLSELF